MDGDTVTLEFSSDDMRILNDALVALPYRQVAGLIAKINSQLPKVDESNAGESKQRE